VSFASRRSTFKPEPWIVVVILAIALFVCLRSCFSYRHFQRQLSGTTLESDSQHEEQADDDASSDLSAGEMAIDEFVSKSLGLSLPRPRSMANIEERTEYDDKAVAKTIEESYGSWRLLRHILLALVEFWAALGFMYWSLLYRKDELMDCSAYPRTAAHSFLVRHSCCYTLACLRGFPILATNMILILMIRIIVQTRIYYSLLKLRFVINFVPMQTLWHWAVGFSMLQGALHFALKGYFDPAQVEVEMAYVRLIRKFVLPGTIFVSFLFRWIDIENTLVPLSRICEQDYTKTKRGCPWLAKIQVMNERVLAFDARQRDIVGEAQADVGKAPSIQDVMQNIINHYDVVNASWQTRTHRGWGLTRSMWPASLLLDRRLDSNDADTRAWLYVFAILSSGCIIVSIFSIYLLYFCTSENAWPAFLLDLHMLFAGDAKSIDTEALLANVVLVFHGLLIGRFIYSTINGMFYLKVKSATRNANDI